MMQNKLKKTAKAASTAVITLLSLVLIMMVIVIGGSAAYTVYLLKSIGPVTEVTLKAPEADNYSAVCMKNADGVYEPIYKVTPYTGNMHTETEYALLPHYVPEAFVYAEDQRFYSHIGVDVLSTSSAVLCEILNSTGLFSSELRGGSTISQQLVKNITNDDEISPERKVREIIRSVNLEQNYTKEEILEKYMNTIYFGQTYSGCNLYGIESASLGLFGKHASELTLAQAASLAAIPQNPERFSPVNSRTENENRKRYCLRKMFEAGVISPEEYENAVSERINLYVSSDSRERIISCINDFENPEPSDWVTDTALSEFCDYICIEKNISREDAMKEFMNGGYEIFVTADPEIQSLLEEKYSDRSLFTYEPAYYTDQDGNTCEEEIQSAFTVMDYSGRILGIVGAVGEKTGSFCWNNASDAHRQPGSAIKPLSVYGYGIENDLMTWSSFFKDEPPLTDEDGEPWPKNYDGTYSHELKTVNEFLSRSLNTLPAYLCSSFGTENVFSFVNDRMKLGLDPSTDLTYASLSVGASGTGTDLIHIAASYVPFGNGGMYFTPHIISRIKYSYSEQVIMENETMKGTEAISEDTAFIINRMLRNVITDGTGKQADIENTEVCGKTGTTENYRDLLFAGLTPDFVSALWIGYENSINSSAVRSINSAGTWKEIIGEYIQENQSGHFFPGCSSVTESDYCMISGMPSGTNCPSGGKGYYKTASLKRCLMKHGSDNKTDTPADAELPELPDDQITAEDN